MTQAGRYDFNDGGSYCGQWSDGKFHGYGVCTGPEGQGRYSGKWNKGFETSGTYTWPNGNTYEGSWSSGKINGLGVETKEKWVYKGEWTRGLKGRYGSRYSKTSRAAYEGTWSTGLQDGYGIETYADGGTYQGQWFQGMRHGHGVRESVDYNHAIRYRDIIKTKNSSSLSRNKSVESSLSSLHSEHDDQHNQGGGERTASRDLKLEHGRGGFVLKARSIQDASSLGAASNNSGDEDSNQPKKSLFEKNIGQNIKRSLVKTLRIDKFKKRSTSSSGGAVRSLPASASGSPIRRAHGSIRSLASADSNKSAATDKTEVSFVSQSEAIDGNMTECYSGEWKNDKRCGYGICSRSDGLKYIGEWFNNKKNGYGQTTFPEGSIEEGKYKNNILVAAVMTNKKSSIFAMRAGRLKEQIDSAVTEAAKASQIAIQKTEVAMNRMKMSRVRAEQAEVAAEQARLDSANAHQISTKSANANIDLSTVDPNQIRYSISISNLSDTEEKRNPDSQNHVQFAKKDSSTNNPIKQILNNSFRHPSIWSRNNESTIKRLDSSRSQTSYKTFDQKEKTFNSKQDPRDARDKLMSNNLSSYNISPNIQTFNKTNFSNPAISINKSNFQNFLQKKEQFSSVSRNRNLTRGEPPMSDLDFPSSSFSRSDDSSTSSANTSSFVPQMNVFERNRLKRNKDPIDIFIRGVPKTNTPTPTSSLTRSSPFSSLPPSFANRIFNPTRTNVPKTSSSIEQTLAVAQLSNNQTWLRRHISWSWLLLVTVNLIIAYFILQVLPNYIS